MSSIVRIGRNGRLLSLNEQALATRVFGATLPKWDRIMVDDGLGYDDRPYTLDGPPGLYCIHVGPVCYKDCTSGAALGSSSVDATFIHEMTHVWQFAHGCFVKLSSLWAQGPLGQGYRTVPGQPWESYNVEQQATLIERWYATGMSPASPYFQYVRDVIRVRPPTD